MNSGQQKVVQYLNEAHASEQALSRVLQAQIASTHGGNYGLALALVAGSVAIVLAVLTSLGTEARGTEMHAPHPTVPSA